MSSCGSQRPPEVPDPLDQVIQSEERRLLRRAVEELPEKMRRCLVLRIDQGLSYREIGAVLRISADTVGAHLHQATRLLKRRLGAGELETQPGGSRFSPEAFGPLRETPGLRISERT